MSFFRQTSLHFRRTALLAVLAMLVPVLVPLFHHPASSLMVASSMPNCGMPGMDGKPMPDGGKHAPGKVPPCPICQSIHFFNSGFIPPATVAFIPVAPDHGVRLHISGQAIVKGRAETAAWPRAPPFLA